MHSGEFPNRFEWCVEHKSRREDPRHRSSSFVRVVLRDGRTPRNIGTLSASSNRRRSAKAGTMGEFGVFSFYPSKNLGAGGDAGMIVCHDETLARKLRTLREHGMDPRYFHHVIGGNFRLDEIQAAILGVKLPFLEKWAAARRAAADFYGAEFARAGLTERISLPAEPYRHRGLTNHHVYNQY